MRDHSPRPMGQNDTAELERLQRAERRAAYFVIAVCLWVLYSLARNAGLVFA